ncbi:hypothetical protein [Magnetospirillum sp. 15-1]|uniref:hypothetical protein n=1 Tax=Magnetospirillum sp. 15-1 TaxID=1979370 RepID=UPI00114469D3|nr:hypothetical protein [Magnetospirillum sp. 15-1]
MLFTGNTHNGVSELYRIDTKTGDRWYLTEGNRWTPTSPAPGPGHYQVLSTGVSHNSQAEVVMMNTDTGESWLLIGRNWQPIPIYNR